MFHYSNGLMLTKAGLALDIPRRQARGFVSHAHADHVANHEVTFCTPETARFFHHRRGARPVIEMEYGQPRTVGSLQLTTLPAGHVFGAAMLYADDGQHTLIYTGDFRLHPSATAAIAQPCSADVLIMESTFGRPKYRFPPRSEVLEELQDILEATTSAGRTPVLHAYVLGKAQEITRHLTLAGWSVVQHPLVYEISLLYEQLGCSLGEFREYDGTVREREVLIFPPPSQKARWFPLPAKRRTVALSGWAMDADYRHRVGVEVALPFSDHADYDELLECVERVGPRVTYCTHGPDSFVDCLKAAGHNAHRLRDATCGPRFD